MKGIPALAEIVNTVITQANAAEGVALLARLLREGYQFSVTPTDEGRMVSYVQPRVLEDQPQVSA